MRRGLAAAALLAATLTGCEVLQGSKLNDAQQVVADSVIGPSSLKLFGAVDRRDRTYQPGAPIKLSFTVTRPAYVAVLRVVHSGETTLLYPNKDHPKALVAANTRVDVPAPGDTVAITAGKPGTVLLEFVASTDGTSFLFNTPPKGAADFAEFGATTRALAKEIVTSLRSRRGADTAAAHETIDIAGN